jgi:hypothetical protein
MINKLLLPKAHAKALKEMERAMVQILVMKGKYFYKMVNVRTVNHSLDQVKIKKNANLMSVPMFKNFWRQENVKIV